MKRTLAIFSCVALSSGAHAAQSEAAVAQPQASAAAGSAQARAPGLARPAQLGRLFYTPTERAQLDLARMQKKPATQAAAAEPVEPPPVPQVVTYGGLVRRSDGRQMLWINNRLVDEKEALAGLSLKGKVRPDGAVTLQIPQSNATVDVKVGQSVEVYSGKVAETRKPPPEAAQSPESKAPGDDAKGATPDAKPATAEARAAGAEVKPAAPDGAEKKGPPGGFGLKMDRGGRALSSEEVERITRSSK